MVLCSGSSSLGGRASGSDIVVTARTVEVELERASLNFEFPPLLTALCDGRPVLAPRLWVSGNYVWGEQFNTQQVPQKTQYASVVENSVIIELTAACGTLHPVIILQIFRH